ncbi:hypothetical protein V5799_000742 [Amblyomma americanum]|uniref:Activator of Hsp90 ATPase AHSA1-like N-terminal domain-containing protein n=1 Tax=Amblyomma americanum TaxID=6943 RepID=A0AAQ4D272_AMBAM
MCRHNTSICATQPRFALQQFHRSSTAAAQVSHFLVASGVVLFVVAVFGLCVSWRLRRRSGDGATAERGARGCGVYGAMALVVMANVIISSAIVYRYVMQARLDVDEDLKYAMYQYFVDASSRDKLDSLHREFKCCGVKNYTDWTMATAGAVLGGRNASSLLKMAKWGEGDPRWIVEERPDATNVNNWHWTEKNASSWSKDKLAELLTNLEVSDSRGTCKIVDMPRCDGDAVANNRKAKLIFFYEWVIELKWAGETDDSDETIEGTVEIPNLSEEHDPEDVDVTVTVSSSSDKADALKELMRSKGTDLIRERLAAYISALKKGTMSVVPTV